MQKSRVKKRILAWNSGLWGLALLVLSGAASAMSIRPDAQAEETLKCLQRSDKPPKLTDKVQERGANGFMRFKLRFERADAAPVVEKLTTNADDEMVDEVLRYIVSYRLPCMRSGQAPINVVQEFTFDALASPEGKPLRWTMASADKVPDGATEYCLSRPGSSITFTPGRRDSGIAQVLVDVLFTGDGQQPPELKVFYSNASEAVERKVLAYMAEYRMPCRKAGDPPVTFESVFRGVIDDSADVFFGQRQLPLGHFLSMVRGISKERVRFDFSTMSCPFSVLLGYRQPIRTNNATSVGPQDLNRTEFMAWLGGLHFDVKPNVSRSLFGQDLVIDVPCGVLDLKPEAGSS
jgi:hypothetical protein